MANVTHPAAEILKHFGLKVTDTRVKILSVLLDSKTALSHSDIQERLVAEQIDKVTIYRNLHAFEQAKVVHKVANAERSWLYAICLHPEQHSVQVDAHAHFVCDDCEKIYCLPQPIHIEPIRIQTDQGFRVTAEEIRLHGSCPECIHP